MWHCLHCMHGMSPVNCWIQLGKAECSLMMTRIIRAFSERNLSWWLQVQESSWHHSSGTLCFSESASSSVVGTCSSYFLFSTNKRLYVEMYDLQLNKVEFFAWSSGRAAIKQLFCFMLGESWSLRLESWLSILMIEDKVKRLSNFNNSVRAQSRKRMRCSFCQRRSW